MHWVWLTAIAVISDAVMPAQMNATVDQGTVSPGDVLRYTLEIEHNPDVTVQVDEPLGHIGSLPIVDSGRDPERPINSNGRLRERRWFTLRAANAGVYALQGPAGSYRTGQGPPVPLKPQEVLVQVGPPGLPDELADIKPIVRVRYWPRWLILGGATLGVLALVAMVVWLVKRRKRAPVLVQLSAHEVAFTALDRLRRTNFADDEAVRRYYFALSEVLRNYVEARFRVNASDMTSEELLAQLPNLVGLANSEQAILREFLSLTDPVKYAHYTPGGPEIAQCYELALSFVEATREKPAPEAA